VFEYIDQNPVAAGLVQKPEDWQYSGAYHRKHGMGRIISLVTDKLGVMAVRPRWHGGRIGSIKTLCYSQPSMKLNGQVAILLCALLWSTSGLFTKLLPWHPLVIAGIRSFIAALFLFAVRLLFPRRGLQSRLRPLLLGALAYSLTMIAFIIANKMTSSANAILLQYTAPVWTALLGSLILKEQVRAAQWVALAVVTLGLGIFFKDSWQISSTNLIGDCIALFSGLCFAANAVFLRLQKEGNPRDSLLLSHILCAVAALPFLFIAPPSFSYPQAGTILFMGVVQIGCASLLFSYGIKRVSAVNAMLTAMIEPLLNPLWVLLIVGEQPSAATIIGGALIIGALAGSSLAVKTRTEGRASGQRQT
jgi:drug/metabolite transporter (DMT)-like permease